MPFLAPWWLFTSYSMWKGVLELFVPRLRFHWHVTEHGIEDPHTAQKEIQRRHHLMAARKLTSTAEAVSELPAAGKPHGFHKGRVRA
jgi:hypothetical protein